jgi:hypothetical protein
VLFVIVTTSSVSGLMNKEALLSILFWKGLLLQANPGAPPPPPKKKHGCLSRRPRPSAGSAPLPQPLYCRSTRSASLPYPAPQPPPSSPPPLPAPLACDLQLASAAWLDGP